MKCEYCGADLSLEAEVCPHCGQLNIHAQQHIQDMKHYKGQFESAQKDVSLATKRYAQVIPRVIIIAVMVILIAVLLFVASQSYSLKSKILLMIADWKAEEYTEILDTYIEEEEFRKLAWFTRDIGIEYNNLEVYEQYYPVITLSQYYDWVCTRIMDVATYEEEEDIQWLCNQVNYFYQSSDMGNYKYYKNADREENIEALKQMEYNVRLMLRTYCHLTEEEADGLADMSDAQRAVLIEGKVTKDE